MRHNFLFKVLFLTAVLFLFGCKEEQNKGGGRTDSISLPTSKELIEEDTNKNLEVGVYIKVTPSMFGYIGAAADVTDLKKYVNDLLWQLKGFDNISSIKLKKVSNQVDLFGEVSRGDDEFLSRNLFGRFILNADTSGSFIERTATNSRAITGTNNSLNADKLAQVLDDSDISSNNVKIFISDMIFSPGADEIGGNKFNAPMHLNTERNIIQSLVGRQLRESQNDFRIDIYRLVSRFNGRYFPIERPRGIVLRNVERPYFMLVMGKTENVEAIRKATDELSSRKRERISFALPQEKNIPIRFNIEHNDRRIISYDSATATMIAHNRGVPYSWRLMINRNEYLENCDCKYETFVNGKSIDSVSLITVESTKCSSVRYSECLKFTKKEFSNKRRDTINIKVKVRDNTSFVFDSNKIAEMMKFNDNTGVHRTPELMDKTFGIGSVLEGINNAYRDAKSRMDDKRYIGEMNFTILEEHKWSLGRAISDFFKRGR